MTLSQIRDFIAVVESGGIRAAARKLGVSQPAITRSVRGLETDRLRRQRGGDGDGELLRLERNARRARGGALS